MYKLIVFIPENAKERVKDALFEAGAGRLGAYSRCSWECLGVGQFLPQPTANPHIGQPGLLNKSRNGEWNYWCRIPYLMQSLTRYTPAIRTRSPLLI